MPSIKLQSSDGVIFDADAETLKQMVTIQTMIDYEEGDNNDEVTPVPLVKAQILEKIIEWTEIDNNDYEERKMISYFNLEIKSIFEIIIAADYLEVQKLLMDCFHNLISNNKLKVIQNEALSFHDSKVTTLLENYKLRNHGYEVIVTIFNTKQLKYFDPKVGFVHCQVQRYEYDSKNFQTETWSHLAEIPAEFSREGSKVCCANDKIYLLGGLFGDRRVTEYNPQENTWRNLPELSQKRDGQHSLCVLNNKIFVIGGKRTTTCEMLDLTKSAKWKFLSDTQNTHYNSGVVVLENKIYVAGGHSTTMVEMYDTKKGRVSFSNLPKRLTSQ